MNPFPSLSHSSKSSLALLILSCLSESGEVASLDECNLAVRLGKGLRSLERGDIWPLPVPSNTTPSFNQLDITADRDQADRNKNKELVRNVASVVKPV